MAKRKKNKRNNKRNKVEVIHNRVLDSGICKKAIYNVDENWTGTVTEIDYVSHDKTSKHSSSVITFKNRKPVLEVTTNVVNHIGPIIEVIEKSVTVYDDPDYDWIETKYNGYNIIDGVACNHMDKHVVYYKGGEPVKAEFYKDGVLLPEESVLFCNAA